MIKIAELAVSGRAYIIRYDGDSVLDSRKCGGLMAQLINGDVSEPVGWVVDTDSVAGYKVFSTKMAGAMSGLDAEMIGATVLKEKSKYIKQNNVSIKYGSGIKDSVLHYINTLPTGISNADLVKRCKAFRNLSVIERDDVISRMISAGIIKTIGKNRKGYVKYAIM